MGRGGRGFLLIPWRRVGEAGHRVELLLALDSKPLLFTLQALNQEMGRLFGLHDDFEAKEWESEAGKGREGKGCELD